MINKEEDCFRQAYYYCDERLFIFLNCLWLFECYKLYILILLFIYRNTFCSNWCISPTIITQAPITSSLKLIPSTILISSYIRVKSNHITTSNSCAKRSILRFPISMHSWLCHMSKNYVFTCWLRKDVSRGKCHKRKCTKLYWTKSCLLWTRNILSSKLYSNNNSTSRFQMRK